MFKLLGVAVLGYVGYSLYAGRTFAKAGIGGHWLRRGEQPFGYWSTLAVYALPFFASVTLGSAAFHSGAGVIGAIVVGIVAAALAERTSELMAQSPVPREPPQRPVRPSIGHAFRGRDCNCTHSASPGCGRLAAAAEKHACARSRPSSAFAL